MRLSDMIAMSTKKLVEMLPKFYACIGVIDGTLIKIKKRPYKDPNHAWWFNGIEYAFYQ